MNTTTTPAPNPARHALNMAPTMGEATRYAASLGLTPTLDTHTRIQDGHAVRVIRTRDGHELWTWYEADGSVYGEY